ncbi:uncharacterized protein LOC130674134 [Microplitis mediator]|uniref:uncharacterized protein LOC130674134 n=1 Tax=Microplitis mediator TaxID=375433 RepID=UPI002553C628|nr:uncharacterized protein LOC130674134 [Microplitis mediator]XP_057335379.1 uncharacterized protein LOC130674134 [Microplitis mediator]
MDGGSTENINRDSMEDLGCLENLNNPSNSFIIGAIIWSLLLLISFLLNATLLLAFIKRPGLRTISNRFVMNLSASNLLAIGLLHPLLITDRAAPSSIHCTLAEGATALVTTSSIFSVLLIAIDQYLAVIDPLRYRTRIDNLKCTVLIILVWLLSVAISLLAIFNANNNATYTSNEYTNQPSLWLSCQSDLPTANKSVLPTVGPLSSLPSPPSSFITYNLIYTTIYIIIIYLVPFITIIWIYICIYTAAHNNSERTRRTGSRPILTVTNYLTDDDYLPLRHDNDINRIRNISSLSSIDESIEITSQLQRHLSPSPIIEEDINFNNNSNSIEEVKEELRPVIFTVGSHNNDITMQFNDNTKEIIEYDDHVIDCQQDGGRCSSRGPRDPRPYGCHAETSGEISGGDEAEEDGDWEKENGSRYGSRQRDSRPYGGHLEMDCEEGSGGTAYGQEKSGGEYGTDGVDRLPYSGHIVENGSEDEDCLEKIEAENERSRGYGSHIESRAYGDKTPYIDHGQTGKLYGSHMGEKTNGDKWTYINCANEVDSKEQNGGCSTQYGQYSNQYGTMNNDNGIENDLRICNQNGGHDIPDGISHGQQYGSHLNQYGTEYGTIDHGKFNENDLRIGNQDSGHILHGKQYGHCFGQYGIENGTINNDNFMENDLQICNQNGGHDLPNGISHGQQYGSHINQYGTMNDEKCIEEGLGTSNQNGGHDLHDKQYGDCLHQYGNEYGSINNGRFIEDDLQTSHQDGGHDIPDGILHGQDSNQNGGLMPPKLNPNPRHGTRSTANYINSLRHRISNGSLFKYREETRAARISALVIVMGFVCWTPFFSIVVMKNLTVNLLNHKIDLLGIGCFVLGTIVSPMLFGYRSRRVKRELRKLFCFRRELAYKNNRSLMAKKVLRRRHSSNWGVDGLTDKGGKLGGFWNFYARGKLGKDCGSRVQFVHVPETALTVDTCRSSFSSGASTQVSSTSTDDS